MVLVTARTRVAPLRTLSIPRLELQAAVLGCKLKNQILKDHERPIRKTYMWTDSRTVLCWIRTSLRRYQQFVAHRIGDIKESTEEKEWKWVPTTENVADLATRSKTKLDERKLLMWRQGPDFLKRPPAYWPVEKQIKIDDKDLECRKEKVEVVLPLVRDTGNLNPERFSDWNRMIRTTSWIQRFIKNCKTKEKIGGELSVEELNKSEEFWLKRSQEMSFPEELKIMKVGRNVSKKSKLYKLLPKLNDREMIVMTGRFGLKTIEGVRRDPFILDSNNRIVSLLIDHHHRKANHFGRERVINEILAKHYVLSLRKEVKKAWRRCKECAIRRAKPTVPRMGELPECRWTRGTVFGETGLDYFGPIEVRVRRHLEKRYGIIYVCMATRAIHLELTETLTTEDCILALKRFVSRRGCPNVIYSDNGRNLRGTNNECVKAMRALKQDELERSCGVQGIKWKFIPPAAPAMAGAWESLIKSVKTALVRLVTKKYPKEKVLYTALIEIENMVNSHPLTYVPVNPDQEEIITPNHFLVGRVGSEGAKNLILTENIMTGKQLKETRELVDMFWKRWIQEYLPTLTRRSKWFEKGPEMKEGDLVIIVDHNFAKNTWLKGRIQQTYPGKDGITRVVDVKTARGTYRRPVSKLALLDVLN